MEYPFSPSLALSTPGSPCQISDELNGLLFTPSGIATQGNRAMGCHHLFPTDFATLTHSVTEYGFSVLSTKIPFHNSETAGFYCQSFLGSTTTLAQLEWCEGALQILEQPWSRVYPQYFPSFLQFFTNACFSVCCLPLVFFQRLNLLFWIFPPSNFRLFLGG